MTKLELKALIKESIRQILIEDSLKDDWKKVSSFKLDGIVYTVKRLEDMNTYYRIFTTTNKTFNSKILDERGVVKMYKNNNSISSDKTPKSRNMTKAEFKNICKEIISGHEYSDHSIIYDLAENSVNSNRKLYAYIQKLISIDRGLYNNPITNNIINKQDVIEKFIDELEQYTK